MFQSTIQTIIDHAHSVLPEIHMKASNTYLTIDQTWVEKGTMQRRPGIHTDGFQGSNMFNGSTINHGYIVSNHTPTAFYTEPFYFNHLDARVHNYNQEMDKQGMFMTPTLSAEYGIYLINAYTPHAATIANKSGYRTFFRIIYDKDKYNRYGNSINRLLDYKWNMLPDKNLSRTFQYMASTQEESTLIAKARSCMKKNNELSSCMIDDIVRFYELLKMNNIFACYNFIYRLFSLNSVQLSSVILTKLSTRALLDDAILKLLFIPLGSRHENIRKIAESIIYDTFQKKSRVGKKDEISGLIYEITNDPRYYVDNEKFNALLTPCLSLLKFQ